MAVLITCKIEEDLIKNKGARVLTRVSPLSPYGSYPLPWKPEFQSDLVQSLMQPSTIQMMLQIGMLVVVIFTFESVDAQT